ncbi:MAG: hypothetical protein WBA61_10480 [Aequorivita sp.]
MKKYILALILLFFINGINYGAIKERNELIKYDVGHEICITVNLILVEVTYCYSWEDEGDGGSWRPMLEANKNATGDIVSNGTNSYLVIHGFNDQLSGVKVNGGKYDMPNSYETVPGEYVILNGDLKVLLKRK